MGRFRPGLRMTALVVVLLPLAVALGFWQLDRASQKRELESARLASYGALPIDEQGLAGAREFTRARLAGSYDAEHQFFVDNHSRHGVPGYLVATPFDTVGGRSVLVSRGWVAAPSRRELLPEAVPPGGIVKIEGTVWADTRASSPPSSDTWDAAWPKRIQFLDVPRMAGALGDAIPKEFRLDEGQPGSLASVVIGEEMTPARHLGYAVQWFALAIATAIAFVVSGLKQRK